MHLALTLQLDDVENPGDTHLNMCAVLSELGRHQQALEHARLSLILLQDELLQVFEMMLGCLFVFLCSPACLWGV